VLGVEGPLRIIRFNVVLVLVAKVSRISNSGRDGVGSYYPSMTTMPVLSHSVCRTADCGERMFVVLATLRDFFLRSGFYLKKENSYISRSTFFINSRRVVLSRSLAFFTARVYSDVCTGMFLELTLLGVFYPS
jgi:hypothetical protein